MLPSVLYSDFYEPTALCYMVASKLVVAKVLMYIDDMIFVGISHTAV